MKKYLLIIIYTFLVFLFAGIYTTLWNDSPDSFIVNDELNVTPFSEAQNYLWGDGRYEITEFTKLYDLKKELENNYSQIENVTSEEESISKELKTIELEMKSAYKKLNQERQLEIKKYEKNTLRDYKENEKKYLKKIRENKLHLEEIKNPIVRYPLIVELGNLKVEYADFRISMAKKEYEVASYILNNYGSFGLARTFKLLGKLHNEKINNRELISALQEKASKARENISNLIKSNYEKRISRLGYIDFFYFSIGISTTTTFGDIVANSKYARAFVGLQLILCVIVVGGLLGQVIGNIAHKPIQPTADAAAD